MKVASPEALARLLFRRLAERGDPGRAITLEQLLEDVLGYAAVRRELGLAGKGEYDVAMLGLLTHRSLLQVDPAVAAAAREELGSPEPGLEFSKAFAEHLLRLRPGSMPPSPESGAESLESGAELPESGPGTDIEEEEADEEAAVGDDAMVAEDEVKRAEEPGRERIGPAGPEAAEPAEPEVKDPDETGEAPCWACSGGMPAGEGMRYCPHCGTDQAARRCASCGERRERDWRFCPRCGRGLDPS